MENVEIFKCNDRVKFRYDSLSVDKRALFYKLDILAEGLFRVLRVDEQMDRVLLLGVGIGSNGDSFWEDVKNLESCGSIVKIGRVRKQLQDLGYSAKDISRISSVIPDA